MELILHSNGNRALLLRWSLCSNAGNGNDPSCTAAVTERIDFEKWTPSEDDMEPPADLIESIGGVQGPWLLTTVFNAFYDEQARPRGADPLNEQVIAGHTILANEEEYLTILDGYNICFRAQYSQMMRGIRPT